MSNKQSNPSLDPSGMDLSITTQGQSKWFISVLSFSIHQPCPESQSFGLLGNFFTLNLQLRRHITATFLFSEHHFHMHIAVNARLDHHSHAYNVNETSLLH